MALHHIKKRNGTIAVFDSRKIDHAIAKAFEAVRGKADLEKTKVLSENVVENIETRFGNAIPEVEGVQDLVERVLMENGFFDVAKAYILYRERHRELRQERQKELWDRIDQGKLSVTKRDGSKQTFSHAKLVHSFAQACKGFEGVVDVQQIVRQCEAGLYDGISSKEISQLTVNTAKSYIERDPAFESITARLFLANLYQEAFRGGHSEEELEKAYRSAFVQNVQREVEVGLLAKEMLDFDLEKLSEKIVIERDLLLGYRGLQTLYDRYFLVDRERARRLEAPQMFWMRVAMGLASKEEAKEERAVEFYEVMSALRYVPSTPTLLNTATRFPQLSSCFLTTVEDDLEHVFKTFANNAMLSKWSAGLGNDWTNVRAAGSIVQSSGVEMQGVVPFLRVANDTTIAINRSGKRRGATCAYLETWHFEIEDFLDLRKNTGDERRRTHDMNTANWIPDLFMKRVQDDGEWTLFSPNEVPELHHLYGKAFEEKYCKYEEMARRGEIKLHKTLRAKDLWKKMLTSLYETGHPWIVFKDPCNIRSPQDHVGVVHSSNLCTEITLNTSREEIAVCNLGSVNLSKHVLNGKWNEALLRDTVKTAVRMLDNVIDINFYPIPETKTSNMRHRPIGLGVMGFQDALYAMNVNFDSDEMVELADESMEIIGYYSILASSELAKERGKYESYNGSKWDRNIFPLDSLDLLEKERGVPIEIPRTARLDWNKVRESVKQCGMRNSNCLAIAPTATIANIAGCFPSIEPIYKNIYVKSNMSGEFTVVNHYLVEDLKELGLWNQTMLELVKAHDGNLQNISMIPSALKNKYKETFEIDAEWLVKAAAARGKWIDQSQSLNIFTSTTSGKRLSDIYLYAWKKGLKTTYYLRTLGASSIEKSTVGLQQQKNVVVESPSAPKIAQTIVAGSGETVSEVKACLLDDPTCEACQ